MAYEDNKKTYVRETTTTQPSGAGMALLVGGLVVAVGFILWLILGNAGPVASTAPSTDTTNVTVEAPAAPAETTTNVTVEPAPEAAEAAPADTAEPAPAPAQPNP
jgi:hypothetical protein